MSKRDKRGIQTLFRTVIKNHYTLLETIDRKASIILTINSILISIVLGAMYLTPDELKSSMELITRVTINFALFSMVFALIAIRPHRYKDRNSLLYAGSFTKISKEKYREEMIAVLDSGEGLYDRMIDDIYSIGKAIRSRQHMLYISIGIFIIGLVVIFILGMIYL
jgi:hypothetical protein